MVHEPTGEEWRTPVRITSTSATERGGFRKCRRQWFLSVVHRLDSQEGNVNFFLGRVYHSALEAYYLNLNDPPGIYTAEAIALDRYQEAFDASLQAVRDSLGFMFAYAEPAHREAGRLGLEMLQNYLERERRDPLLDEVLAVEFRVNVAIRNPKGRKVGVLSVQADVVGYKDGELCVVDHKTASSPMHSAHLDIDDQLTAEVFSWWQHSGDWPDRAIYNVSLKKEVHPPKQIKGTKAEPVKLSRDRGQRTSYKLYREEVERLGLAKADYVEILAFLKAREDGGEDPLFQREAVFRTPGQMAAFERDLFEEWRDMRAVAAHPERAYPNPTSMNCSHCPVRAICTTIQDGGDAAAVIRAGYIIADPRR